MKLRRGTREDLAFVTAQEARPDYAAFIEADSVAEHEKRLADPDKRYLMIVADDATPLGYAILTGLSSPHDAVELKRMVVATPGRGIGGTALRLVVHHVLVEERKNRLWLIAFADNVRARRLYGSVGFVEEGTLRQAGKRGGVYCDAVTLSLLRSEWKA